MRIEGNTASLSATDLASRLGCRHLTQLEMAAARGVLKPPAWYDPAAEVLRERGMEHELAYLTVLAELGRERWEGDGAEEMTYDRAVEAMRAGADVIVQAPVEGEGWRGRADVLLRVGRPSSLGAWSYEVTDTKLARDTRAGTILQLCLYSELVGEIQGVLPEWMHVVTPGTEFVPESYRVVEYLAYHRMVKRGLEEAAAAGLQGEGEETYPEPGDRCEICRWWSECDKRRRDDDHLSLVAGITSLQRKELVGRGTRTLAGLAGVPLPLEWRPERGAVESYERAREQARVQVEGRESGEPVYELLPREPQTGLARLPEASAGDVFFDIEGDPFVGDVGLEYLLGWTVVGGSGEPEYACLWAASPGEERKAFEEFVDRMLARWETYPDMHIYHFAPYEPAALKRLMGRHATREDEIDRMLRAGLFVDLYAVVRQGIRASVEHYSIKDMEQFYGFDRAVDLREASANLHALERVLELGDGELAPAEIRDKVEGYNRDDCVSTLRLRDWVESLRAELVDAGEEIARPEPGEGEPGEELAEQEQRVRELMERLMVGLPEEEAEWDEEERGRWLPAQMLEWHRRENKAPWWEYFRLRDLSDEELLYERVAVSGLEFVGPVEGTGRTSTHRYQFVLQDSDVKGEDALQDGEGNQVGSVAAIDLGGRTLDIKKRRDTADTHPTAVFVHSVVRTQVLSDALFRLAEWVADHGIDQRGSHRAARDLLLRMPPRFRAGDNMDMVEGQEILEAARQLGGGLNCGVLPVQGPPGSGKTYTGARMICSLVRAGKRVGVTAVSHKVVRNLLEEVVRAAEEEEVELQCVEKVSRRSKTETPGITEATGNDQVLRALTSGSAQVAGGTAWLWARADMAGTVDVLFVDEAGQMSLANVLAVAQAAESVVLLGDPQQLEQPMKGSHPEGTNVSALEHLLDGRKTIPEDRGLFLADTWRLHPDICAFTSEVFYEGRLRARPGLERQAIVGDTQFAGAGLWFVGVEHEGNQNASPEEVEVVAQAMASLTGDGVQWVDARGQRQPMTEREVLVVAPYNAHVGAIQERLPDARVGTVDRFQGQEAPVVIYSMATSAPDEAPRGMEFLYSLNRLNVATSRARCACILVANPQLFAPECGTPKQIQLANGFCRYLEMAER